MERLLTNKNLTALNVNYATIIIKQGAAILKCKLQSAKAAI